MMEWVEGLSGTLTLETMKSGILLLVLLIVRALLGRAIVRNPRLSVDDRRRWVVTIRNGVAIAFIVGLIFIWAHELQTFVVSLAAIAVALVLATKELLLCLSGTILRAGSNAYSIGDRVQIGAHRGIVLDQDWITTTLLEIGPGHMSHLFTGRTIVVPNSLLLTTPLANESYTSEYVFQVVTVPLKVSDDWRRAEQVLLDAAKAESASYLEDARQHMKVLGTKNLLEAPSVDPRVTIQLADPDHLNLLLRLPMPGRGRGRIEQAILRRFLAEYHGTASVGPGTH